MKVFLLVVATFSLPAVSLAQGEPTTLSTIEMVVWAATVSAIGGASSAWRESNRWNVIGRTAANTMVLGASIVLLSSHWTSQSLSLAWSAIGLSGLLSLGGLAVVDWAHNLVRQKVEGRVNEPPKPPQ